MSPWPGEARTLLAAAESAEATRAIGLETALSDWRAEEVVDEEADTWRIIDTGRLDEAPSSALAGLAPADRSAIAGASSAFARLTAALEHS